MRGSEPGRRMLLRDELVGRNVASLVEAPVVRCAPVEPLTPDEARTLPSTAAADRLRVLWLVMLSVRLRHGEALGLRWGDLDLDTPTVMIRRSLQRVRGARDATSGRRKGTLVEVTPKTAASAATIALPDSQAKALGEHRRARAAERLAALGWVDPDLVFTTPIGTPLEPRNVSLACEDLCVRAAVRRTRLHDLRHASTSVMLLGGVELKALQTTLRHSRLSTTSDVYAHVIADVPRQAAAGMDGVLRALGEGS